MRKRRTWVHVERVLAGVGLAAVLVVSHGCRSRREQSANEPSQPSISPSNDVASADATGNDPAASKDERPPYFPAPTKRPPSLTESIEYTEGGVRHTAWLSTELVVELRPSPEGARTVQRLQPSAEEVPTQLRGVRVWKIRGRSPVELANDLTRSGVAASPVFHPSPAPSPQLSALPGGVLAKFPPDWNEGRVAAWLAAQGAAAGEKLAASPGVFLVPSDSGMKTLELVRKLERTGVLLECYPNWIRSATLR